MANDLVWTIGFGQAQFQTVRRREQFVVSLCLLSRRRTRQDRLFFASSLFVLLCVCVIVTLTDFQGFHELCALWFS